MDGMSCLNPETVESWEGSEAMYGGVRLWARGDRVCVSVCVKERGQTGQANTDYRRVGWQMCCPLWADEEKQLKLWGSIQYVLLQSV